MRRSAIVVTVLMAFAAAACSDGEAEPTEGGGGAEVESCDSPVETASITISDLTFDPACFKLPSGTTELSVSNQDSTDHTFTIPDVDLNEDIDPSEDAGVDVSALPEGVYAFRCSIHPQMTGVMTI